MKKFLILVILVVTLVVTPVANAEETTTSVVSESSVVVGETSTSVTTDNGAIVEYTSDDGASTTINYFGVSCRTDNRWIKARGLFGTLWSFKLRKDTCWNGRRVKSSTLSVMPDVTTYGAFVGWTYEGEYASRSHHYYNWISGQPYSGHTSKIFGEFQRCLVKIGCVAQEFVDIRISVHKDGSKTSSAVVR